MSGIALTLNVETVTLNNLLGNANGIGQCGQCQRRGQLAGCDRHCREQRDHQQRQRSTFTGPIVVPGGSNFTLNLQGTFAGTFAGNDDGTTINAIGDLTIGDATSSSGFSHDGQLDTNGFKVTLLDDSNEALLGEVTTVDAGGELEADGGINLGSDESLTSEGLVDADVNLFSGQINGSLTIEGTLNGAASSSGSVSPGPDEGVISAASLDLNSDVLLIDINGTAGAGNTGGHDSNRCR